MECMKGVDIGLFYYYHLFSHLLSLFYPAFFVTANFPLVTLVVVVLNHQSWSYRTFYGLVCLETKFKIDIVKRKHGFYKWAPSITAKKLFYGRICWIFLNWPWLMRSANKEKSEYFYLREFFPQLDSTVEIEIRRQPQY